MESVRDILTCPISFLLKHTTAAFTSFMLTHVEDFSFILDLNSMSYNICARSALLKADATQQVQHGPCKLPLHEAVRVFSCLYMCVWVRLSVYAQVYAQTARGGRALLTQPVPLRALNRRCYLVSQVLKLCCSNATGAQTSLCTRWLCVEAKHRGSIQFNQFFKSESGSCCFKKESAEIF